MNPIARIHHQYILYIMRHAVICAFCGGLLVARMYALDAKEQERNNVLGNWWQIASLHIGSSIELNTPNGGDMGLNIGVSGGWNYVFLTDLDIGLRARYLYFNTAIPTHSLGGILYVHSFDKPSGELFSFALGGGLLISHTPIQSTLGSYIEIGTALFKYIPINGDLLYRASFYPPRNALGMAEMVHGIHIVFGFF